MTRYQSVMWTLGASLMSTVSARAGLRGLPPELIALMLRMALPVAPKLSDILVVLQASGHWHDLFGTMMA